MLALLLAGPLLSSAVPEGLAGVDLSALAWRELGTAATRGPITRFAVPPGKCA